MTIAKALKAFFNALNGQTPSGNNIAEVIRNGTANVQRNNESALSTRMATAEGKITASEGNISTLNSTAVKYEAGNKSFVLASSTADSVKTFLITVTDDGTISGTEIVE